MDDQVPTRGTMAGDAAALVEAARELGRAVSATVDAHLELVRREWRVAVLVVAVLVVFLVAVPAAAGAPAPPAVQRLADDTAAWVEDTTGVELQPRRVELVDAFSGRPEIAGDDAQAIVPWSGDRTEIRSGYGPALRALAARGARPWSPYTGRLLLHELLHRLRDSAGGDPELLTRDDLRIEEGAVEAVAADLWPAWVYRFTGRRPAPAPGETYPDEVDAVRAASSIVTGSPWQSRPARLWRRALWAASVTERRAMMGRAIELRDLSRGGRG